MKTIHKFYLGIFISIISTVSILILYKLPASFSTCTLIILFLFLIPGFTIHLILPYITSRFHLDRNVAGITSSLVLNILPTTVIVLVPFMEDLFMPGNNQNPIFQGVTFTELEILRGFHYLVMWITMLIVSIVIGLISSNLQSGEK